MKNSGPIYFALIGCLALGLATPLRAADADANLLHVADVSSSAYANIPQINIPVPRARMSADLALNTYEANSRRQAMDLGDYSDTTTIEAELPQTKQKGRFELKRMFAAPKSIAFKTVDFVGDSFVKTNVIARLLQSEVDHVQKGDLGSTAITSENYRFSYKGTEELDGQPVHVYQVKPRQKRAGLFKGKIYLDVYSGSMRRAEGRVVKSPSFFVKKIDFVQDYAQVGEFNLISHIHTVAEARIVGRTVVDITHTDYKTRNVVQAQSPQPDSPHAVPVSYPGLN